MEHDIGHGENKDHYHIYKWERTISYTLMFEAPAEPIRAMEMVCMVCHATKRILIKGLD